MIWRIRSRKVFDQLSSHGLRVRNGSIRMTFVPLDTAYPQVALAIGKRFGNAVERNRGRRRCRAAFGRAWDERSVEARGPLAGAYLLTARRSVLDAPFPSVVSAMSACLNDLESARNPSQEGEGPR